MRVRRFSLPLSRPLGTARGEITEREGFLVGIGSGIGEATPLPGWTESLSACATALDGVETNAGQPTHDALDNFNALDSLDARDTPAARHGLALALGDGAARNAGRSLAAQLVQGDGQRERTRSPSRSVPVNATVGDGPAAETVAAAERAVADGFDCLKVKVGARPVDTDVERLRAVREAVGPAVALRADANGAWDGETAAYALDRLEPLHLEYVEQPLPATLVDETAQLRTETDVPIALDESLSAVPLSAVLDADAADVLVCKPMVLGGPDRTVSVAKRAHAAGVDVTVTTTIDGVVARTAAVHVAAAIPDVRPCGLATGELLSADLASDPCSIVDGRIAVPSGPGLAGGAFEAVI